MKQHDTFICEICHEEHPISERILFHGAALCERCLDAKTTICDCCGERVWVEESVSDSEITICQNYYDGYYTRCERCDGLIRYDDAVYFDDDNEIPYCSDCAEEIRERRHVGLNSYGYKPMPIICLSWRMRIAAVSIVKGMVRGTDVAGIAYFTGQHLTIQKAPRLAHKSVLYNDKELRNIYHLPCTKIQTDSYIAVQLLEREEKLDFNSLSAMAEAVRGSFTFTVLDDPNSLYIVKGNNPMCILHFKDIGFYLYASTQEILFEAVEKLGLDELEFVLVPIQQGNIMRIAADGSIHVSLFNDSNFQNRYLYDWGWDYDCPWSSHFDMPCCTMKISV